LGVGEGAKAHKEGESEEVFQRFHAFYSLINFTVVRRSSFKNAV
jgi:hypothetical protein